MNQISSLPTATPLVEQRMSLRKYGNVDASHRWVSVNLPAVGHTVPRTNGDQEYTHLRTMRPATWAPNSTQFFSRDACARSYTNNLLLVQFNRPAAWSCTIHPCSTAITAVSWGAGTAVDTCSKPRLAL